MTYKDDYIEREWKYLETAWNRGLLGEGFKVVAYCPSCQTSLSNAEVSLGGYEQLEDPSLYYKVRASDGAYLVVWTTMPFTVVTDELVAVKPDAEYVYLPVEGETWVVCADRVSGISKELGKEFGEPTKSVKGAELTGLTYVHPLLSKIRGLDSKEMRGKIHKVVAEEFVDTTTGTGLVHIAPANGEDDFAVAQKLRIPVFAPFDDQVRFTEEAGDYRGMFARDADSQVVNDLGSAGALVKAGKLVHDYPVCWRSGHRIVWLARREYFYWVDRIREDLVKAAESVEYFSESPRNRFLEFIKESKPWGITRERVWGSPLPVWSCEKCGHKTGAFSRKKIVELASELPDGPDFELHRPWIDRVVLKCEECGGRARREPFVLDTWHDSGAAPYASFTDEEYRRLVPVAFLTEGIDQTRGWAYTLLVLNVLKSGKAVSPYRQFMFQGHVLDEKGRKMSKSLGNTVWALDLLRQNSADVSRFYLASKGAPEDSLSLDLKEMTGRPYQVLNTLYHLHLYLVQNGEVDGYHPVTHTLSWVRKRKLLTTVDRWMLSKVAAARRAVAGAYAEGKCNVACRVLDDFVISSLSQTYVRLVRGELWSDSPKDRPRRLAVFAVMGHALRAADEMLHPVSPFLTEFLHQEAFAVKPWKTPLIAEASGAGESASKPAEEAVDYALLVEATCNSARTKARLKRRWPLNGLKVLVAKENLSKAKSASRTIRSLCNVNEVETATDADAFPASFVLEPNRSKVGALFKKQTGEVLAALKPTSGRKALAIYFSGRGIKAQIAGASVDVPLSAFEFRVTAGEGFEVSQGQGLFVAIRKDRDEGLMAQGLVRDVARRLQALRKKKGFIPTKMLRKAAVAGLDQDDVALLLPRKKELAFLVRVKSVEISEQKGAGEWEGDDLDGRPIYLHVG